MTTRLTTDEVSNYHERGYHIYREQVMSTDTFAGLTALFEALNNMPLQERRGKAKNARFQVQQDDRNLEALNMCHLWEPRLMEWLLDDDVLDLVEGIIGPDIALFSSHFICKQPTDNVITPWHDDRFYWRPLIEPMDRIVTVWLAIDDSTEENGCMRVIPGTHLDDPDYEFQDYDGDTSIFLEALKEGTVDDSSAVSLEIQRGQCSLHDARIVHGAEGNTSPKRRCGYTMRYFSTALKMLKPLEEHPVWLARGRDIAGNDYVIQ
jgi:ectoine hydroxylase-related dioxygenase (phytanoyl-CoA dioxygenase family)